MAKAKEKMPTTKMKGPKKSSFTVNGKQKPGWQAAHAAKKGKAPMKSSKSGSATKSGNAKAGGGFAGGGRKWSD